MRATSGLDGDGGQAVWTLLRRRLGGRRFLFSLHAVDGADEQEHHEGIASLCSQ